MGRNRLDGDKLHGSHTNTVAAVHGGQERVSHGTKAVVSVHGGIYYPDFCFGLNVRSARLRRRARSLGCPACLISNSYL